MPQLAPEPVERRPSVTQQCRACQSLSSCPCASVCERARSENGSQLRRVCSVAQRNESGTKRFHAVGGRDSLETQLQLVRQIFFFFSPLPCCCWTAVKSSDTEAKACKNKNAPRFQSRHCSKYAKPVVGSAIIIKRSTVGFVS